MSLQSTDQIADLITRIRNAIMVGKTEVYAPTSKLKVAVVEGLKKANYIDDYEVIAGNPRGTLKVVINAEGSVPRINAIKKVSKPGRRIYIAVSPIIFRLYYGFQRIVHLPVGKIKEPELRPLGYI